MALKIGTYLQISLNDGSYAYGRVLWEPYIAFYSLRTEEPSSDLEVIDSSPVLFKLAVRIPSNMQWVNIGHRELSVELRKPVVQFMQSIADFRKCIVFDSAGEERSVTPEECVGLERAAVWDLQHIEKRILDTFEGRPNLSEMSSRVRLK
ncbi:MAG: immunity 26/phosphotriesterase HocA family protein [Crocinitomix sp.]|nr:immunity 26/phosphotriesterase HocA family protein [Crocinitomix sp.]